MKLDIPCQVRCPVKKCLDLRHDLQPCFFHVDHHASIMTDSELQLLKLVPRGNTIRLQLISYWQRLFLDTLGKAILACAPGSKARSSGGERYLDTVEVDGSRPSAPTTQLRASACLT
jgi:hypothetical protein